ncbi:hypothetical protein O4H49_11635 [Kiloniella laminariae]|uniref:Uncharacterized protein n=1 Tax=Kiloniella laminariae TaxID=454162 RepID=A0ABT4LJZ5_9PROT|nr:hypothetical protein [Kiloniella laminariae]MCZ4281433.1 hypothetical protein [Kiloniella laminariae]
MKYQNLNNDAFDFSAADMEQHILAARRMRSAEAHRIVAKLLHLLASPFVGMKTRYVLALTRTA